MFHKPRKTTNEYVLMYLHNLRIYKFSIHLKFLVNRLSTAQIYSIFFISQILKLQQHKL